MELYTDDINKVKVRLPQTVTGIVSARYSVNNGPYTNMPANPVAVGEGTYELTLPYIDKTGTLSIEWTFNAGGAQRKKKTTYDLVRPILEPEQIKALVPGTSTEEAINIERVVRKIIEAYTNQSFGLTEQTITVRGHGNDSLSLPQRLVSLNGVETIRSVLDPKAFIIVSDGWYLKKKWAREIGRKTSDEAYFEPSEGVIFAPTTSGGITWATDYPFTISGLWGYESVPTAVVEAARLLVNDYACGDIVYRDRYVDSVATADWRFAFSPETRSGTGNVRADWLLNDYIIPEWHII